MACVGNEHLFALDVCLPECFVRQAWYGAIPELLIVNVAAPIVIKVASKKFDHLWSHPRECVDAVGDVSNRDLVNFGPRPEELPHLARDLAVELTHAIMQACQFQCEDSHAVDGAPAVIFASNLHELIAGQPEFVRVRAEVLIDEVVVEGVIACRNRGMRREEGICANRFACFIETQPCCHQFATPLEGEEGSMSLVDVPGCW